MTNIGDYLLAEVILWFIYATIIIVAIVMVWSVVRSLRNRTDSIAESNRVPRRKIAYGVAITTLLFLTIACLAGSSTPIIINGINYTDRFWLKTTDGLITVSLIMMVVAACFVAYGLSGINRRIHQKK